MFSTLFYLFIFTIAATVSVPARHDFIEEYVKPPVLVKTVVPPVETVEKLQLQNAKVNKDFN